MPSECAESSASAISIARVRTSSISGGCPAIVFQSFAVEKLHGNELLAVLLTDVVDGADVGMIQSGSGARLALEALQRQRILSKIFREELQGYESPEPGVLRFIDHTHATAAQLSDDDVMRDGLTNQRRGVRH